MEASSKRAWSLGIGVVSLIVVAGGTIVYAHFRPTAQVKTVSMATTPTPAMDPGMIMAPTASPTNSPVATTAATPTPVATNTPSPTSKATPNPTPRTTAISSVKTVTPTPSNTTTTQPAASATSIPTPTSTPTPTPAPAHYSISISGFAFSQPNVTIKVGDSITWTNQDSASHTVTSTPSGPLSSATLGQGDSYTYTFLSTGTFNYHCSIHTFMTGNVIVQ